MGKGKSKRQLAALELDTHRGRKAFAANMAKPLPQRWGILPATRAAALEMLQRISERAEETGDLPTALGCLKTLAMFDALNQRDEHLHVKIKSEESGERKITVVVRDERLIRPVDGEARVIEGAE